MDYLKKSGGKPEGYVETLHQQKTNYSVLVGMLVNGETEICKGFINHIISTEEKLNTYEERLSTTDIETLKTTQQQLNTM